MVNHDQSSAAAPVNGARFVVYLSPTYDTERWITKWALTVKHEGASWQGNLTSDAPTATLQVPGFGGMFNVTLWASGPNLAWQELMPQSGDSGVECNSACQTMVGILASPMGYGASYWMDTICPLPIQPT